LAVAGGAEVVFARSMHDLPEDMLTVRPTVIVGVPRVYERVWEGVEDAAAESVFGRLLVQMTLRQSPGETGLRAYYGRQMVRLLLGRKVQARFGGRMRVAVSGGAPLSARFARPLRAACTCP
jgi:long-chain acyl-CoA synthetase